MNGHRIAVLGALLCLLVLSFSDTAQAQNTICVGQQPCGPTMTLTFTNVPTGTTSPAQTVPVTTNSTETVSVTSNQPWLIVNGVPTSGISFITAPTSVQIQVDAHNLSAGATTKTATITFTIQNTSIKATVTVNATVTSGSALLASPSNISFTATQGASVGSPASVPVTILATNGTATLNYNSTAATSSGGTWLLLTNPNGTTSTSQNTVTVSVNPSGLGPGTYTGTITAASMNDTATVIVTLTVAANATLSVAPTTLPPFLYEIGQATPAAQQLTLTSSAGSVNFSISTSTTANWLIVSPTSGTANSQAAVTLSVNPSGLPAGVNSTSLIITPSGGTALPGITVTLVVSNNPLLKLSASALSYNAQFAGQNPADQQVQVTTTGSSGSVGFTFSSDSPSWLSATASGSSTPATLTVHVSIQGLQVSSTPYTGTITMRPTNGDQYTESIIVSLTVSNTATLVAGPPVLVFSDETTQSPPQQQNVQISSLGLPATFTVSTTVSNCGSGWITATTTGFTTPATLTVTVNPVGLPQGVCSGNVVVGYNSGGGNATLFIPVAVNISTSPLLDVSFSTGFGVEVVRQGAAAFTRSIALTSTDPFTQVNFAASASGLGLSVGSNSNMTPQNLVVTISPAGLAPNTYNGQITITSAGLPNGLLTIPITLVVNPNVTVTVTPAGPLTFAVAQNGPPAPAQTLTLASSGGTGATFTTTVTPNTGGTWVQISPTSGSASGQISVSLIQQAVATLSPGTYTSQITIAFQNAATAAIAIPVSLTVGPPQTVAVSNSSLSFSYQIGSGQAPASQTLQVTSTGGPVQINVGVTSSGWLSASPNGGPTPLPVSVQVNTQGLNAGTFNGTVSISAPGVLANPITVNVTLTVIAMSVPNPTSITNSASSLLGAIAPGEIITIKGMLLGPSTPSTFKVNAQGGVDSTLSGVQVLFDNIAGTPIYVSATQINAIVPYEIAGRFSTNVVVAYQNQQSAPIQQIVANVAPSIFTLNTTGQGQAAVLNQDYTVNGPVGGVPVTGGVIPTKPASPSSIIAVYATGGGQTDPPSTTGSVAPTTTLRPLPAAVTVTATIGSRPAAVTFAGSAPGLVSGVIQVNVQVPNGVGGNNLPIVLTVNGVTTPLGVTVAVEAE